MLQPNPFAVQTRPLLRGRAYFIVLGITLLAALVFCTTLYRAFFVAGGDSALVPPPGAGFGPHGEVTTAPARLTIHKIGVDAAVQYVALSKKGTVGTPNNFTDVAWYTYSPVPGTPGRAIIDGHLDNALGLPGVFQHLDQLGVGDVVYVSTTEGKALHFRVTKTERLAYNSTDTTNLFAGSPTADLLLITCSGEWFQSVKQYSDRLIVYTTLVP